MILGFGNNVVSSLASDITASQTSFSVLPGDGPLFSALLTSDFSNKSTTLKNYAKITLTDSGETAFEVCHLTAVSGDTLTVIRGQEGTAAKGWSLKDVVANFATRGSENAFPQIAHIQSGFYTSGTAGGTANALTLELPTTFFLNGSTDWVLKTPIVVYPAQNNTGAATLQLTMGGRVLGTFKLYKGSKAELVANDILKDVALVCLMDNTRTFFNVANPGAIYAGLGTAAFRDVQTSKDDVTAGRLVVNGGALALRSFRARASGGDVTDVNALPPNSVSFTYSDPTNSPGFNGSLIDFSGLNGEYSVQLTATYANSGKNISFRTRNGDNKTWNPWYEIFHTGNPPTTKTTFQLAEGIPNAANLNNYTAPGLYYQPANAQAATGTNYPEAIAGSLEVYKHAGITQVYRVYNNSRAYIRTLYSGTWTAWSKQYDTTNKPTAADVGALASNGNAVSATKLQTARTINGVAFDGTKNISISAGAIGSYTKAESDARFVNWNYNAVGSVCLARFDPQNQTVAPNATTAGANLHAAGITGYPDTSGGDWMALRASGTLSGTWRCLGFIQNDTDGGGNRHWSVSLFVRIA
jgi:hypothetical protein